MDRRLTCWTGVHLLSPAEAIRSTLLPLAVNSLYHKPRVPHTPEFPVKLVGFRELHAPFLHERRTRSPIQGSVQEIRCHNRHFGASIRRFPHLAKTGPDMGHPRPWLREGLDPPTSASL